MTRAQSDVLWNVVAIAVVMGLVTFVHKEFIYLGVLIFLANLAISGQRRDEQQGDGLH